MKIVQPHACYIEMADVPHAELMEACGRICYKSEDKITHDSAEKFVTGVIQKGHKSVTEFAVFTVTVNTAVLMIDRLLLSEQKYLIIDKVAMDEVLITGTVRAWREAYLKNPEVMIIRNVIHSLAKKYPVLFGDLPDICSTNGFVFIMNIIPAYELERYYQPHLLKRHRYAMVKFQVSRAVSHELVRHRPVSWLQESQRYCRYSDAKFGNEVTFIEPGGAFPVLGDDLATRFPRNAWREALTAAEDAYFCLLSCGISPQCARLVLPNSCKTELVMIATLEEFQIFFGLRLPKTAEPSMREVTHMVYPEFTKRWPELFPAL